MHLLHSPLPLWSQVRFLTRPLAVLMLLSTSGMAQLYWDANGDTAGAATGGVANGTWTASGGTNWTTNPDGTIVTGAWTNNGIAIFSAGADATGASQITLSGTVGTNGITVQEGAVTIFGSSTTNAAGGNRLVYRGNGSAAGQGITLTSGANGTLTFDAYLTLGQDSTNTVVTNQSTHDIVFLKNMASSGTANDSRTLRLSNTATGGIVINNFVREGSNTQETNIVVDSSGSGVVTLAGNINLFAGSEANTGSINVEAGNLLVSNTGEISQATGINLDGATAVFRYEGTTALTRTVSFGAGGGTFLYNSADLYTGGAGAIAADTGDTIGGNGRLGDVTINAGGALSPGQHGAGSAGQLTVASLTLEADAASYFNIFNASSFDQVQSEGAFAYGGALNLNFGSLLTNDASLDLFDWSGILAGTYFSSVNAFGSYTGSFSTLGDGIFSLDNGSQILTFTSATGVLSVVPEPGRAMLLMLALGAFALQRRRMK